MAARIGTILVKQGLVSEKDLEEALQRQVIFGGRLGTNLIEMGSLAEEALLKVLSQQQGFPYAEPHFFEDIPKGVIDSVPLDLVDRHGVIPINKEKNRIILAMIEPGRLDVIDEVQFRTNCVVKPVIASELRITQALERYYKIRRDLRFIALPPARGEGGEIINFEKGAPVAWGKKEQAVPAAVPPPAPPAVNLPGAAPTPAPTPPAPLPVPSVGAPLSATAAPAAEDPLSLEPVNLRLTGVRDRNDVAAVVTESAAKVLGGVILFLLKGEEATGWAAQGEVAVKDVTQWKVRMEKQSILAILQDSKNLVRGPGKGLFATNPWLAAASPTPPREVIAIPLVIKGRVVCVLMGFSRDRQLGKEEVEYLVRLMRKATVAFEILIMQSKLVMV
jgi:hypothetical protein